jgi:hypothetical protein
MEIFTRPQRPNILTSDDGDYWRAVRQAVAPCFSMSNLKQVGELRMCDSLQDLGFSPKVPTP